MTAFSSRRLPELFPALLLAAGLMLLQALIGGRVMLFAFPGYCVIGLTGLVGLAYAFRARTNADSLCLYGTAIFLGYILVRALTSSGYVARADLFSAMAALVVYGLTATTITSSRSRRAVIAALLAFALVHVLIGAVQFSRGDDFMLIPFLQRGGDYGERASGFYVCPNHLAGLLEVVGIFGVSLTIWGRWPIWAKLITAYASAVCYLGVALTGSRGGYLSVLGSFIAFGALSLIVMRSARPKQWWKFAAITLVALLALCCVAIFLFHQSEALTHRAGNMIDTKNMRVQLWRAALQQWHLQPVIGTGSGTYRFYGRRFRADDVQSDPIDVHNDYLHLLCEYGLIGAAGFLLFFSAHLRQGWRNLRFFTVRAAGANKLSSDRLALNIAALSAIAAYMVHSVVDFNLHVPANAALLALVFGIVANLGITQNSGGRPTTWTTVPRITAALVGLVLLCACGRMFMGEYFAERARTALRDEDPAASILLGTKALEYETRNPEVFFYLGRALIAVAHRSERAEDQPNYFGKAIVAFQEAHRLAPLDGTYPLDLAFVYDQMGRFVEAEAMYNVARSLDPHSDSIAALYRFHLESWAKTGTDKSSSL